MKQVDVMKRDNILVSFLAQHRGGDECVSSKEIAEYLGEQGYKTLSDTVPTIVRKVMFERMLPICSLNSKGYFWAETQDEIQRSINELQGRIYEMQDRIELLNKFILK